MRFHRKKITADAAGRKHGWRSGLEKKMQDKLQELGIDDNYESKTFEYIVPETKHKYTPDFPVSPHIVIETKGLWEVDDRMKMLRLKEQYPEIEFRMFFQNAQKKIKKGSKTSYADYCDKYGLKWAEKTLPQEWIDDIILDLRGEYKLRLDDSAGNNLRK